MTDVKKAIGVIAKYVADGGTNPFLLKLHSLCREDTIIKEHCDMDYSSNSTIYICRYCGEKKILGEYNPKAREEIAEHIENSHPEQLK